MAYRLALLALWLSASLVLGACAPRVSAGEVREQMLGYLEAWNADDFAGWTANWSPTILAEADEADWHALRAQTLPLTGRFVAIRELSGAPYATSGYTTWTAICQFEQVDLVFSIVLPDAGGEVQGISLDVYSPGSGSASPSG